jgi:RNA polymerase sigma-70 factor (ECF subfamily)
MDEDPAAERHLVDRARAGDPDAWELLYRRAYPRLIAYARRRLAAQEQAEEAVSETMVRAMDMITRYRPRPVGIEAWLFGIARHVVLEAYRAGARQRPVDPAHLAAEPVLPVGEDPESAILHSEERRLLARAFSRLSPQDQDVLELRVLSGLGAEQVGEMTGRRPGAVRTAQSRALARLRVEFEGLSA